MNEKISTAKSIIRESHSLLTLISHSDLDGVVDANGVPQIDAAVIHSGLAAVCRMLDSAEDALEDFELETARLTRKEGAE